MVAATALGLPFKAQKESFSSRPPILSGSRRPDLRQPYIFLPEEMGVQGKSLKCLRLIWALVLLSVMLFGIQARTQEVTAGITGTVTDHQRSRRRGCTCNRNGYPE